jgi:glycolate oxidase
MSDNSLLAELVKLVGIDNVLTGEAADLFATDVYRKLESPVAAFRPASVEELQELVRFSANKSIPFTIRGGGASYTDGYVVADSQHLLEDLGLLKQIEINHAGGFVTVEAGVTWAELAEALDKHGLRIPFRGPFSGLRAAIAGSVSQNSLSYSTGKYGISAESVLALDVIWVTVRY